MERDDRKQRVRYSGNGSPDSPFVPMGSPDILSFSLELARNNVEPLLKGGRIYARFNEHVFAILGHPEKRYIPERVDVYYVGPQGHDVHLGDAKAAVTYSQRFHSSFLMEIFKKALGM